MRVTHDLPYRPKRVSFGIVAVLSRHINQETWCCENPGLKSETWGTLASIVQTCATRPEFIARLKALAGCDQPQL